MRNKKGISLIVLIITIIVVIILAAVVILTLSKNNPIESAKEARFKEDVRTFQDELALYISKQYANAGGHWDGNISAKSCDEIVEYIPSFTKKYEGKFIINNNQLEYTKKLEYKEKEYAQSLNVNKRKSILPDEYQEVEYIESTGTQYIDTRIKLKDDLYSAELGFQSTRKMQRNWILAVWYKGGWQCAQTNERFVDENGFRYSQNNDLMAYTVAISDKNTVKDIPITVRLFGQLDEFGVEKFGYYKLFYCKIFYANNYLRNYVPCYSTTTVTNVDGVQVPANTKGLYDLVEGKFYTNQGTGEFIAGLDVD